MAVLVLCDDPSGLLRQVRRAIQEEYVETWSYDQDGDLTHKPPQWRNQAWMRPQVGDERLTFNIIPPRNIQISREIYAVYHGRLIEMLLSHFDNMIRLASATALPIAGDKVK